MPNASSIMSCASSHHGHYLTKSLMRLALTCPRKLLYARHQESHDQDGHEQQDPRGSCGVYPVRNDEDPLKRFLAGEGRRFEHYCQSLFPHGVSLSWAAGDQANRRGEAREESGHDGRSRSTDAAKGADAIAETKSLLTKDWEGSQRNRVTIFEGAVCHGPFYVRPDVLDLVSASHENSNDGNGQDDRMELRLIEIKSKGWDSSASSNNTGDAFCNLDGSIRAPYRKYIQDVAFQTMVVRRAFPQFRVTSWLMLPDRSKISKAGMRWMRPPPDYYFAQLRQDQTDNQSSSHRSHPDRNDAHWASNSSIIPTLQETINVIDKHSVASLLPMDHLIDKALHKKISYPGSAKGITLSKAVHQWAGLISNGSMDATTITPTNNDIPKTWPKPPIGIQCATCEYRTEHPANKLNETSHPKSGFNECWEQATNLSQSQLQTNVPIIHLYGFTKHIINKWISQRKYTFSQLEPTDLDLIEDRAMLEPPQSSKSSESSKKISKLKNVHGGSKISRSQRQWYQISSIIHNQHNDPYHTQKPYILKRKQLRAKMNKWSYPFHFIDFETTSPILPYTPNKHPYDVVAFQFSHHILDRQLDGKLVLHHASEFFHRGKDCPNNVFLNALCDAIGHVPLKNMEQQQQQQQQQLDGTRGENCGGGTIFQWSPFENNILSKLLSSEDSKSLSSQQRSSLSALLQNGMVDLAKMANDYYYVHGSGGSSSIKRLLGPTMNASTHLQQLYGNPSYNGSNFTNFQWCQRRNVDDDNGVGTNSSEQEFINPYDIMASTNFNDSHFNGNSNISNTSFKVAHGGAAAAAYQQLQCNPDLTKLERTLLESSLLRYCELDTLAMAMIVQAWQGFLEEEEEE